MSDRELKENRSPDELRYLKDHIASIRSDPDVVAAAEAYENTEPLFTLEAFRSGVLLDGSPCRMTIGTLALLRGVQSRCLGYGSKTDPLSDDDIALAFLMLSDEDRNSVVSAADDLDELAVLLKTIRRRHDMKCVAFELYEFLRRIDEALQDGPQIDADTTESPSHGIWQAPDDAWADDVDIIAHEYGWNDLYILWELPLVRSVRLKESRQARRSGQARTPRRAAVGIALLEAIEQKGNALKKGVSNE